MIFSASWGSLENLNERTWCGLGAQTVARRPNHQDAVTGSFVRHRPTVGNDTPASSAIWVLVTPSAARNTIRARNACC